MHLSSGDRVLVVGGSGFIGRHLLERCLRDTSHVVAASRSRVSLPGVEWRPVDLTDPASIDALMRGVGFDYVFNLAGRIDHTPYGCGGRKVIDQHFLGVMNLIDACSRSPLKGFVQVGSSDEYGDLAAPQDEDRVSQPISPYAFAKQSAGAFVRMLAERERFPATVVRLFLVYGPGQDDARFLPQVIMACLRGERFPVSPGDQRRDFCYVDDIVDGLLRAALTPAAHGTVVNLASGHGVTVREMIGRVVRLVGGGTPEFGARPYRNGESMALVADVSRAATLLGWRPATSLDDGLARTISHYRARCCA